MGRKPHSSYRHSHWVLVGVHIIMSILLLCPTHIPASEVQRVARVVDGDTLQLSGGQFVRYIGINAPEIRHGNKPGEPLGIQARLFVTKLLEGGDVILEAGAERSDRYGRRLAYVYTSQHVFVNLELLRQGLAHCLFQTPNDRYRNEFIRAQRRAMQEGRGMWRQAGLQRRAVVGNRNSLRFHRLKCPFGRNICKSNRQIFSDSWQAFFEGFAPCKKCFPDGPFQ